MTSAPTTPLPILIMRGEVLTPTSEDYIFKRILLTALILGSTLYSVIVWAHEGMLFTEGYNVGIGTAAPTNRLHLASGEIRIGGHVSEERLLKPVDFQISGGAKRIR